MPERSYAESCDWEEFKSTLLDEFVLAHLLGWFAKAFIFRDYYLCWIMSIAFELLEVTFQHMLPNFKECWWDHIILDLLLCNWIGFSIGLWVANKLRMMPMHWTLKPDLAEYKWEILRSFKRIMQVITFIAVFQVVELNAFFLKNVLNLPPSHPINLARLMLWWGIGFPGSRESYQYMADP